MKFPDGVNLNTYLAYKQNEHLEPGRKLKSEIFDWDINSPKSLTTLCVQEISGKWMGKLSTNLLNIGTSVHMNGYEKLPRHSMYIFNYLLVIYV